MNSRIVGFLLVLIAAFSCSTAGVIRDAGIDFGAGQSFEMGYFDETYNKFAISSDLFIELLDLDFFSLRVSAGYSQKGSEKLKRTYSKIENGGIVFYDSIVDYSRKSDYLTTGIFLKPQFPIGSMRLYLLIGPRFDYLIKREYTEKFLDGDPEDVTSNAQRTIFGMTLGVGYEFAKGKFILSPSFVTDFDFTESEAEYDESYKNFKYAIVFSVGYRL